MAGRSWFPRFRLFPRAWGDGMLVYPAILVASFAGLAIVGMNIYKRMQIEEEEKATQVADRDWQENLVPPQSFLIDLLLRDVTKERTLVLFKNGTVVVVQEPTSDPKGDAISEMEKVVNGEGAFAVNQVEGDYVVRYEGAAFTRLSGDQVNQERSRILKYWGEFLDEKEEGVVADGFDAKVGLVARSFLRADAKDLKVTKILKAKSEETGEN